MCTAESDSAMNEEKVARPASSTGASASRYTSTGAESKAGRESARRARASARRRERNSPASATAAISAGVAGAMNHA